MSIRKGTGSVLFVSAALVSGIVTTVLAGCGGAPNHAQVPVETQIQAIQNNPHMPAAAKAAAIGELKAHNSPQPGQAGNGFQPAKQ